MPVCMYSFLGPCSLVWVSRFYEKRTALRNQYNRYPSTLMNSQPMHVHGLQFRNTDSKFWVVWPWTRQGILHCTVWIYCWFWQLCLFEMDGLKPVIICWILPQTGDNQSVESSLKTSILGSHCDDRPNIAVGIWGWTGVCVVVLLIFVEVRNGKCHPSPIEQHKHTVVFRVTVWENSIAPLTCSPEGLRRFVSSLNAWARIQ